MWDFSGGGGPVPTYDCYLIRSTNLIDIRLLKMHFVINLRESLKACQNQMIVVISDIVDFFNIFKLKCFKRR